MTLGARSGSATLLVITLGVGGVSACTLGRFSVGRRRIMSTTMRMMMTRPRIERPATKAGSEIGIGVVTVAESEAPVTRDGGMSVVPAPKGCVETGEAVPQGEGPGPGLQPSPSAARFDRRPSGRSVWKYSIRTSAHYTLD